MKTKITIELLEELGFVYDKEAKGWCYPDITTKHAFVGDGYVNKFHLKKVVRFMIIEQQYRLLKNIEYTIGDF